MNEEGLLVEQEHAPPQVPHLGHALLFLGTAGLLLLAAQAILLLPKMPAGTSPVAVSLQHPKLLLAAEGITYVLTMAIAWLVLPLLWGKGFLAGIQWNGAAALRLGSRLVPLGLCTGWAVQGISSLIQMPKSIPMDSFFRSPSDVWLVTIFGTLLAPLFEEVCFRGFLLPACAIAWDWLGRMMTYSLDRLRGQASPELADHAGSVRPASRAGIVVASLLTSALFAFLHAQQLGYAWKAVLLLGGVSLVLTVVRLRTHSVACSTLTHSSYNLSVFLLLFIGTGGYRHLDRMVR